MTVEPSPGRDVPQAVTRALVGLAVLNLTVAAAVALTQTHRANDLLAVYGWCRTWLFDGTNPYMIANPSTDYPPNALVTFAPLALVSPKWIVPLWIVVSLGLAPLLPYLVGRRVWPDAPRMAALVVAAFLCWSSARVLLQFSVLSMTLAFTAVWLADSRWIASGVCLGLALAKPHIAAPVALWALLTGRVRVTALAGGVVALGFAIFCVRAGAPPGPTLVAWGRILADAYTGPEGLIGLTGVRAWAPTSAAGSPWRDVVWLGMGAALLAVPIRMAMASRRAPDRDQLLVLGSFSLWSLLAFYHNGHNLILMLPAFVACWVADDPATRRERPVVVGLLQAAMMADIPDRLGHVAPDAGLVRLLIVDFDRYLVLLTFGYLALLWRRRRDVVAPPQRPGDFEYNARTPEVLR